MQKFCKVGANLAYFKREGCSCKQRQGEHWKTKISLVILRGGEIDTGGGGGGRMPPPAP